MNACEDIGRQIARIGEIYILLDEEPCLEDCDDLMRFVKSSFNSIDQRTTEPALRDMAILSYLALVENIETASFQFLQMVSVKMRDKQIKQLLRENFFESKANQILFFHITAKYIQ